jgi:hypothetical protein
MTTIHDKTVELMPWFVNGTLPDEEHREIEAHLRDCLVCRAAAREEQQLRTLVRRQDDLPLGPGYGVADLLGRIDGRQRSTSRSGMRPRLAWAFGIAAAAIAGALLVPLLNPDTDGTGTGEFTTLTSGSISTADRIDIVFTDAMDTAAVLRFVDEIGGRIVNGPTDLGRYTIELSSTSDAERNSLIETLGNDARVRFAGRNFIESAPPAESDR